MEDVGTQLANVEHIQQTIREHIQSLENGVGTEASELESILPNLAALQNSLRGSFDEYARPLIRQLHIFNLPEELLVKVFEDVRGNFDEDNHKYSDHGVKSIQRLRLTCRRFCDASSHLLLHQLQISFTTSSLDRLDEVCRHPTISKGVRALKIDAAFYDPDPAQSLREFTSEFVEHLRLDQRHYSSEAERQLSAYSHAQMDSPQHAFPSRVAGLVKTLRKRHKILSSCTKFLQSEFAEPDQDKHMAALCRLYRQYSELVIDQKALLQHGTFVTRFAGAVARMPTLTELRIQNWATEDYNLESRVLKATSPIYKSFRSRLLVDLDWTPYMASKLPERFKLLYQLPIAFFNAGNRLLRLEIHLDENSEHDLKLSQEETGALASVAERLQTLDLDYSIPAQDLQSKNTSWNGLSELARLFANGKNLNSVALRCGLEMSKMERYHGGTFNFEPLLALLPWANLKEIELAEIHIHYRNLKSHIDMLTPGTYIRLDDVYLLSGSWADLLDVVRTKADRKSVVERPLGKEDIEMGDGAYEDYVWDWLLPTNPASEYIRGETSENPLRLIDGFES
jgi:hypothetical protein